LETLFLWLSDDVVRFKIELGVVKKCTKMSTPFQVDFPHKNTPVTPQPSLSNKSLSLAGDASTAQVHY